MLIRSTDNEKNSLSCQPFYCYLYYSLLKSLSCSPGPSGERQIPNNNSLLVLAIFQKTVHTQNEIKRKPLQLPCHVVCGHRILFEQIHGVQKILQQDTTEKQQNENRCVRTIKKKQRTLCILTQFIYQRTLLFFQQKHQKLKKIINWKTCIGEEGVYVKSEPSSTLWAWISQISSSTQRQLPRKSHFLGTSSPLAPSSPCSYDFLT